MYRYQQILTRMRSGESDRAIARAGLMDRHKLASLRRVAEHAGWLDPRNPLPEETAVAAGLRSRDAKSWPGTDALAIAARRASNGPVEPDWYVTEGKHGQQLLESGQTEKAAEIFRGLLTCLGDHPSYARAVVLGRLARCFYMSGCSEPALARLQQALDVIDKLVPNDGVRALHGTLHSELGEVLRAMGQHERARQAFAAALRIAEELQDTRAQGVDCSQLGTLAVARGKAEEALGHYQRALSLFQQSREPSLEAAAWSQLGKLFHEQQQLDEAERHYREAARIREEQGKLAEASQTWHRLAIVNRQADKPNAAQMWYRKAIDADQVLGNALQLASHLADFADFLQSQPGRLVEARRCVEAALDINRTLDPAGTEIWKDYGILAVICAKEATTARDEQQQAELEARAHDYRELHQYAPRFLATLAQLDTQPSYGRAVILGRLGRCFYMSGCSELAIAHLQEALDVIAKLAPSEGLRAWHGSLHSELGEVFRAIGEHDRARRAFAEALKIAEELQDLRAQGVYSTQLGTLGVAEGKAQEALGRYQAALSLFQQINEPAMEAAARSQLGKVLQEQNAETSVESQSIRKSESQDCATPTFEITLDEELITDYGFDGDLLVDGPRERRIIRWTGEPRPLAEDSALTLAPGMRTCMDDSGAIRFCLPLAEPVFERGGGCTVMRRLRREITVSGSSTLLWRLIRAMNGSRSLADVLSELPANERAIAASMLGALAATGAIDTSGRPIGRFLHSVTKKGVMPAGGLEGDEVLQLATDGDYRTYAGRPRIPVGDSIPERLRSFHALVRSRRSRRDYNGSALDRNDFDALLHTACGVTGAMSWAGREVELRAYPSSGALYAVEIYPVVMRVGDLSPGVYHFDAIRGCLEVLSKYIDLPRFIQAILPMEREMVAGAAAMICLAGRFRRHERKYGEGGYRMLIAEAGHISQNMVLAATALGLSARPFGGVFDDLLNRDLGIGNEDEQFLLSVIVGHVGDRQ